MRKNTSSKLALIGLVFLILILAQPGNVSFQMETFQGNGNFPINNFSIAEDYAEFEVIEFTATAGNVAGTASLSGSYNTSATFCLSVSSGSNGEDDANVGNIFVWVSDTSTLSWHRADNDYDVEVQATVIEINPAVAIVNVYNIDSFNPGASVAYTAIGGTVNVSASFISQATGDDDTSPSFNYNMQLIAYVYNSTHIAQECSSTYDGLDGGRVQVVEIDGINVYFEDNIDLDGGGSASYFDQDIDQAVDTARSWIFGIIYSDSSQATTRWLEHSATLEFVDSDTVRYQFRKADVASYRTGRIWVIEWPEGWVSVQHVFEENMDNSDLYEQTTITAVSDQSKTIAFAEGTFGGLIYGCGRDDESTYITIDDFGIGQIILTLESTTTVNGSRGTYGSNYDVDYYVCVTEWLTIPNNVPVNDQAPTSSNLDKTDYLFAQYREYQITAYVSDADGYADIDYLEIGIWDNSRSSEYYRIRYDEDTNTFSEEYDAGTMATLNTGSSSATESGNDIDATFYITIDWDFTDLTDCDLKVYVVDDEPENDTDWYEVNWNIETRLTTEEQKLVLATDGWDNGTDLFPWEYADTEELGDSDYWSFGKITDDVHELKGWINFTNVYSGYSIVKIDVLFNGLYSGSGGGSYPYYWLWDWTAGDWDQIDDFLYGGGYKNFTVSSTNSKYWSGGKVRLMLNHTKFAGAGSYHLISVDYAEVKFTVDSQLLSDGSGTLDRGDYDTIDGITANGTISYYGFQDVHPASDKVDVWISCSDVAGSPWSDLTLSSSGYFETTVDSDDLVGLDTYTFIVVEEGTGSGGSDLFDSTMTDTYVADRLIFTATCSVNWQIITYSITVSTSAIWDYDDSSFTGSYSWSYEVGSTTQTTGGNYSYHVDSFTDSIHGVTAFVNNTDFCFFDTIVVSPPYYWVQYSPEMVWFIWGSPSTYTWLSNSSGVGSGVVIQSYVNGSANALATTYGSGSLGGLAIGSFSPSWYWATITINAEVAGYDWAIWNKTLNVDILHSLHIENFEIEPTDYWFWIAYTSNLGNASITIWDDAIDSGLLFTDAIYYSASEGFHSIARSTVVGTHNVTICITSDGNTYGRYYNVSDWVWWYNWSYIVQTDFTLVDWVPSIEETTVAVSGTISKSATWDLYYDGSESASYSGSISAGYFDRISWTKHEVPGFHSWKLTFTNGTDTISIGGVFYTYQTNIDDKPDGNTPDPDLDWRFRQTTWQNIILVIIVIAILGSWFFPKNINRSLNLPNMKE